VLANGHVLIPQMARGVVVEYDTKGNGVWTYPTREPIAAVRLPNGHTLITCMSDKRAVEVDAVGKTVWEDQRTDSRVTRASRRRAGREGNLAMRPRPCVLLKGCKQRGKWGGPGPAQYSVLSTQYSVLRNPRPLLLWTASPFAWSYLVLFAVSL